MLYDFHRTENAKRPGSVHATYVITGVQKASEKQPATNGTPAKDGRDGADDIMQSSPYLSSSMPQQDSLHESVETVSIILAREEDLAGTHAMPYLGVRDIRVWWASSLTGRSGQGDLSVNCVDLRLQLATDRLTRSQCSDGRRSRNVRHICRRRSFGNGTSLRDDPE